MSRPTRVRPALVLWLLGIAWAALPIGCAPTAPAAAIQSTSRPPGIPTPLPLPPTWTPSLTPTPLPSGTPFSTATPLPTITSFPTYTPTVSPTIGPSSTLAPTSTATPGRASTSVPTGVNPAGVALGVEQVADDLDEPTGVAFIPDNNLPVVIEKGGAAWIIDLGRKVYPALMEISGKVNSGGEEQGLLGLAFHPQFASNRYLYVAYTNPNSDVVVARYTVRPDLRTVDPATERLILTVPHPGLQHNGGHLAFGPDGMLYLGVGDGGGKGGQFVEGRTGQLMLGAILRIDVTSNAVPYTIPGNNPFAGMGGMAQEIWLYGLRNPWRFSFDRAAGDLYIGDVGEASWEEIDYAPAGQGGLNYGWPLLEGRECYPGRACSADNTVLPIAVHGRDAGCSVVGGYVYRGQAYPDLDGVYFYGDFCTGSIWGLARYYGAWKSVWLLGTDIAITSFGEDVNGELYLTDYFHGRLYRLTGHR